MLIPHRPWRATPDGRLYENRGAEIVSKNPLDPWTARERGQRLALQEGLLDTSLARIRARLVAQGLWDRAVVIVTADHGINVEPGTDVREPAADQLDELYRVPLLIKAPGQRLGVLSDAPAARIDILPTLLGLLGRVAPERGSRAATCTARSPRAVRASCGRTARRARSRRGSTGSGRGCARTTRGSRQRVRAGRGILRVGPYGRLLGTVVGRRSGLPGSSWTRLLPETPRASRTTSIALVSARVTLPGGRRPADGAVLVVRDGRVAGLLGGAVADHGGWRVLGVVDWLRFRDGPSAIRLALATDDPAHPRLRWLTERPARRATRPTAA